MIRELVEAGATRAKEVVVASKRKSIHKSPKSLSATKTRTEFMQKFEWEPLEALGLRMDWIGSDLFVHLDADRRAVVTIATTGIAEHYRTLVVKILNKREGEVDRKSFSFSEHLDGVVKRLDARNDLPQQRFEVISHCVWDWYIAIPATTTPLTEAVAAYVATFV